MGPRIPRADSGLKGIIKTIWALAGLVVVALVLGVLDLVLHAGWLGAAEAGVGMVLPFRAVGLLLGAASCAALCCSARRLAARLKGQASSGSAAEETPRCRWYSRQGHAFGNHMQIVSGLLALKRFDDAREYIARITESLRIDDTAQFDKSCPELDDTLCRKIESARSRGVGAVVLRWDPCHRLEMPLLDACRIIGLTLDLAIECAASCARPSRVCVSNCTGSRLYSFLIEWGPVGLGGELTRVGDAAAHIAASGSATPSAVRTWRGLRAADVASLAEQVSAAGGAFTFGGDLRQGFVEFSLPAVDARDQE
jgi:hypothetical protein